MGSQSVAAGGKTLLDLRDPAAVQRLWHQTTQRMNKTNPTHGILFINGKPSVDPSGSRLIVTYAKDSAAVFPLLSTPAMHTLLSDTLAEVAGMPVPFELVLAQPDPASASAPIAASIPESSSVPMSTSPVSTSMSAFVPESTSTPSPIPPSASDPADMPPADVYDSYAASYSDPSEPDYDYAVYGDPSEPDYQPPVQSSYQQVASQGASIPAAPTPQAVSPSVSSMPTAQPVSAMPDPQSLQSTSQPIDESQRVRDLLTDVFGTGVTFENLPPK